MSASSKAEPVDAEGGTPRVIKRYANRKMYDTQRSRYVTLDQIAELIREGEDVRIIDNNSKQDLTSVTLAQIIFEEEKKQRSFLPLQAMRSIIQSGGERIEELVTQAKKGVTGVFNRKDGEEHPDGDPVDAEDGKDGGSVREFREWIASSQNIVEEWQKRLDDRIRNVVGGISPLQTVQKEIGTLVSRIGDLEKKLVELAKRKDKDKPDQ